MQRLQVGRWENLKIPAAQYVRMSTDDQHLSIENQKAAIAKYAAQNGFRIVDTYAERGPTRRRFRATNMP